MKKRWLVSLGTAATLALAALPALAHGPSPQRSTESIEIAAPPEKVWKLVSDYAGISQWHPGVTDSKADKGNASGSERVITLPNGGTLTDNLNAVDEGQKVISWRLLKEDVEVFPTSSYTMRIAVLDGENGGSKVEWSSTFFRGDTHNEPPEHLSDEAALAAVQEFQRAGLEALKQKSE